RWNSQWRSSASSTSPDRVALCLCPAREDIGAGEMLADGFSIGFRLHPVDVRVAQLLVAPGQRQAGFGQSPFGGILACRADVESALRHGQRVRCWIFEAI